MSSILDTVNNENTSVDNSEFSGKKLLNISRNHIIQYNNHLVKKNHITFQEWVQENKYFIYLSFTRFLNAFNQYMVNFNIPIDVLYKKYVSLLYSYYTL